MVRPNRRITAQRKRRTRERIERQNVNMLDAGERNEESSGGEKFDEETVNPRGKKPEKDMSRERDDEEYEASQESSSEMENNDEKASRKLQLDEDEAANTMDGVKLHKASEVFFNEEPQRKDDERVASQESASNLRDTRSRSAAKVETLISSPIEKENVRKLLRPRRRSSK